MEDKYKNRYRIPSARLKGWDYGTNGLYYVTICTKDRIYYFGNIEKGKDDEAYLNPSELGQVAQSNWMKIPSYHPYVQLDDFVVMPNHIHGLLFINNPDKDTWSINKYGPQSKNLASILRGYKSSVKQFAMVNQLEFSWQERFYDRIIRTEKECQNVRNYIYSNPNQWLVNGVNFDNLCLP